MPPPPSDLRRVDPRVWRACAGSNVEIPAVNSRVYYFPQGHINHYCPSAPVLSPLAYSKPLIHCVVTAVDFLADPVTDEVFARILLLPDGGSGVSNQFLMRKGDSDGDGDNRRVLSFSKVLTPSDANNGGGFSVPRFCADSIFPPLNYNADPPVQTLSVSDVHGNGFDFRHIYRGTPRRHLLTTGWSKFVNNKKLIAGDSVVFMRDSTSNEMFIGVRRILKMGSGGDSARWRSGVAEAGVEGYTKGGRGRVTPDAVVQTVERAAKGLAFEILYYPRVGCPDFVVRAEAVDSSLRTQWAGGMRVKMAVETEDSSRMSWFQGTVESTVPDHGCWGASPWRMLQIKWDEPEVLQNAKTVSPWRVEFLAPSLHPTTFPPTKKFKFIENSGLMDQEGDFLFPKSTLINSTGGYVNPSLLNYFFPAGMQGARQDNSSLLSSKNFVSENNTMTCNNNFSEEYAKPELKRVSTELNIGSLQSDNLSPESQSSHLSFGTELTENRGGNLTQVGSINSLQLFGKIIYTKESIDSGSDVGSVEDERNEIEAVRNDLDLSLTYQHHYSEFCL